MVRKGKGRKRKVRCLKCGNIWITTAIIPKCRCLSKNVEELYSDIEIGGEIKKPSKIKQRQVKEEISDSGEFHLTSSKTIPLTGEDLFLTEQLVQKGVAPNMKELYKKAINVLNRVIEGDPNMVDINVKKEKNNPLEEFQDMAKKKLEMEMTQKLIQSMGQQKKEETKKEETASNSGSLKEMIQEMQEQIKYKNLQKMLKEDDGGTFNMKEMMQMMMMKTMMETMMAKKPDNSNQILEILKALTPQNKSSPEVTLMSQQLQAMEQQQKQNQMMDLINQKIASVDKKDDMKDFVKQMMENNKKSEIDILKDQLSSQKERLLMDKISGLQREVQVHKESPTGTRDFRGLMTEFRELKQLVSELNLTAENTGPGIMEALSNVVDSAAPVIQAAIENSKRQQPSMSQQAMAQKQIMQTSPPEMANLNNEIISTGNNNKEDNYPKREDTSTIPEPEIETPIPKTPAESVSELPPEE